MTTTNPFRTPAQRAVAIIDAPNIDAVTTNVIGHRPGRHDRFDPIVFDRWAQSLSDATVETALFTNVPTPTAPGFVGWLNFLVESGIDVFAKPKLHSTDDIDDDMVAHIASREWATVTVFSHDAECFADPLAGLARGGIPVRAVGFRECAGRLAYTPGVEFVDAEDIPGLYRTRLPRMRLENLPSAGGWLKKAAV